MRDLLARIVTGVLIGAVAGAASANEASRTKAREAMVLCESVDRMPESERPVALARLAEGLAFGEAAIALDPDDARAHLALCCNLGKQIDLGGLNWRIVGQVRRMRVEIDRAQALDPDDIDVLITKGEMLRRLPRVFGGDRDEGVALLRRAVELRPDSVVARLYLARALAAERSPATRTSAPGEQARVVSIGE